MSQETDRRAEAVGELLAIVDRLRDPEKGCPWDREQTLASMAPHLIEEAYELVEAIEVGSDGDAREEAGDLLMVVALICRIASEEKRFDLGDAAEGIAKKLVRRHPHVFGEVTVGSSKEALANWEAIKREERREKAAGGSPEPTDTSALAGVPKALPALQRARRLCGKAMASGFRWSDIAGAFAKLEEEVGELREVLPEKSSDPTSGPDPDRLEHELGDVLLSAAFLGEYLGIDPERACRRAERRFEARYRAMESGLAGELNGRSLEELPLPRLLEAWEAAKAGQAG